MSDKEKTDKKRLYSPAVSDVNDDMEESIAKNTSKSDYGTSSRELKTVDEKMEPAATEFPCRYILYAMMFFGFAVAYSLRVSLNEAIVAMVNQTAVSDHTALTAANVSDNYQCPRDPQLRRGNGELVWDRHQQGTVLAAFYYGYILTQVRAT